MKIRELEGMEQFKGFFDSPLLDPKAKTTTAGIVENGIRYTVDVENGQKTGFFLDQVQSLGGRCHCKEPSCP